MTDKLTFWFGADAEKVWAEHLTKEQKRVEALQAEADRLRSRAEECPE